MDELAKALRDAVERVNRMTPDERDAMYEAQRQSWVRGMQPCEHGVRDFEQCADCRREPLANPTHTT